MEQSDSASWLCIQLTSLPLLTFYTIFTRNTWVRCLLENLAAGYTVTSGIVYTYIHLGLGNSEDVNLGMILLSCSVLLGI